MSKSSKSPAKATAKAPKSPKAENQPKDVTTATADVTNDQAPANEPENTEQATQETADKAVKDTTKSDSDKSTGKSDATVVNPFYDLKEKTTRKVGDKITVSAQRAKELRDKGFIK